MSAIAVVPKPRKLKDCKAKGTRNEHKTIALLKAAGYNCVRAGGSLGPFDVIGFDSVGVVLVQCKSNSWAGSVEMETMRNIATPPYTKKLIHRWVDRKSKPDVREVS